MKNYVNWQMPAFKKDSDMKNIIECPVDYERTDNIISQ